MSLLQRIQERYPHLRRSERVVADYLRQNADQRLDLSITDFSRVLGISEATVSRVCKALGYDGFQDLKLSLAAGAFAERSFANIPTDLQESDSAIATSQKLANALIQGISNTQRLLDANAIESALETMQRAQRLLFIGVGGAASICDEAVHLLLKAGFNCISYRDGYTQTIAASTLSADDCLIGISHTGRTQSVVRAMTLARRAGAPTIAITGDRDSAVASAADLLLLTGHRDTMQVPLYGDFIEGRACQLFLIDLLYIGLLFRTSDSAKATLRQTTADLYDTYPERRED